MTFVVTLTSTCDPAHRRAALGRVYRILLELAENQTADPGNFGEEQGSAAEKSPTNVGDDLSNFNIEDTASP